MEKSKRELILDAALKMFVDSGFENSPTSKISKQAGVATGTLFHYFETKEKLVNELYLEVKNSFVNALKKDIENARTIRQKLETIWYNGVTWVIKVNDGYKFLMMFSSSAYISEKTKAEGLSKFTFILEILKEGLEEEILKDVPVILMNEILFSMIFGTAKIYKEKSEELEDATTREKAFSLFWDAIKR